MSKIKGFIDGEMVPEYTEFDAEYLIGGDTDSIFLDLSSIFDQDADIDEVCQFGDQLGEAICNDFNSFVQNVFNVPEERAGIIQTKREIISDKSLFLAKKKYIMSVVDKEGNRKRFHKIMGAEIIKSDTPVVIQEFLLKLTKSIMEGKSIQELDDMIAEFREEYFTMSPIEIGVPTTIKNLTKYEEVVESNKRVGKPIYHGLPRHAKAAIIYNTMAEDGAKINGGSKIKLVYVRGQQFDSIAIPSDLVTVPSFLEHVEIDYMKMWVKVKQKIDIYTKPLKEAKKRKMEESLIIW